MWKYMEMDLDPLKLPTKQELLDRLKEEGGTDNAFSDIREEQYELYNNELIWRYPISQGESAGGFVLPVREGILWIPYDEMEREEGEILLWDKSCLLSADDCIYLAEDYEYYAKGLCSMLREAATIIEALGFVSEKKE